MKATHVLLFFLCTIAVPLGFSAEAKAQDLISKDSEEWAEIYDPPYKQPTEIPKGRGSAQSIVRSTAPQDQRVGRR